MANDRSNFFFNVLALENILVALNREIGDGPCFLYIEFSWIGVWRHQPPTSRQCRSSKASIVQVIDWWHQPPSQRQHSSM